MRPVNTILARFRRAAAVPAAPGDDLARELVPLFAALDVIEGEREEVRARATRAAELHRENARVDATEVEAAALEEAEAARRAGERESRRAAAESPRGSSPPRRPRHAVFATQAQPGSESSWKRSQREEALRLRWASRRGTGT